MAFAKLRESSVSVEALIFVPVSHVIGNIRPLLGILLVELK